jgi:hypothetical protein
MAIQGIEGMSGEELMREVRNGGKFVVYHYCISVLILTFRRGSNVHFIRAGESAVTPGLGFTFLSLVFGWWGIPWGPIYTIGALITNLGGGKDVTSEIVKAMSNAA